MAGCTRLGTQELWGVELCCLGPYGFGMTRLIRIKRSQVFSNSVPSKKSQELQPHRPMQGRDSGGLGQEDGSMSWINPGFVDFFSVHLFRASRVQCGIVS